MNCTGVRRDCCFVVMRFARRLRRVSSEVGRRRVVVFARAFCRNSTSRVFAATGRKEYTDRRVVRSQAPGPFLLLATCFCLRMLRYCSSFTSCSDAGVAITLTGARRIYCRLRGDLARRYLPSRKAPVIDPAPAVKLVRPRASRRD